MGELSQTCSPLKEMISINCQDGSTIFFHEIKLLRSNPFHMVEHEKLLEYKLDIKFRKNNELDINFQ